MTFLISLEQVPAATTVALGLGIDEGDALMRLMRLRLADEEPTVYSMSHLPVRVVPTLDPASVRSPTFALRACLAAFISASGAGGKLIFSRWRSCC